LNNLRYLSLAGLADHWPGAALFGLGRAKAAYLPAASLSSGRGAFAPIAPGSA